MIFASGYTSIAKIRDMVALETPSIQILAKTSSVANRKVHIVTSVEALRKHRKALLRQRSAIIVCDSIGALAALRKPIYLDAAEDAFIWEPRSLRISPIRKRLLQRTRNIIEFNSKASLDPAAILIQGVRDNGVLDKVQTWIHKIPDKSNRTTAQRAVLATLLGHMTLPVFIEKYTPKRKSSITNAFSALVASLQSDYGVRVRKALQKVHKDPSEVNIVRASTEYLVDAFELRYITKSYKQKGKT